MSKKPKPLSNAIDDWLSRPWVKAGVIALSVLVWSWLLIANWNGWSFLFLWCAILPLLLVPFIWGAGSNLLSRMLLLLAVAGVVLSAFLVRIWLSVNLAWQVGEDGRIEKPIAADVSVVHPGALLLDAAESIELLGLTFGSWPSPITLTLTADPPDLVRIEPALVVVIPNRGSSGTWIAASTVVTETLADGIPDREGSSLHAGAESPVVADRSALALMRHNHQGAQECEEALTKDLIPWQQLFFWLDLMLGDRCHWTDATVTVGSLPLGDGLAPGTTQPMTSTSAILAGLPVTFTTSVETIARASLRQFAGNSASTGSPLLVLIPSTVALAAYVFSRQQDQAERKHTRDQESAAQEFERFMVLLSGLNLDSAMSKQNELERYARSGYLTEQQYTAISDLMAIGSGQTLPESNRIQMLLGEYPEPTIAAAALRPTDNPSGEHRDMMKAILASSQLAALKATNSELSDRFSQARERVEQVSQCEQQEWSKAVVIVYVEPQLQRLKTYLGTLDPFTIVRAEQEDFGAWCELDAFWPGHPVNNLVSGAAGEWVISGEAGSGKTALARADRARMVANPARLDGLWIRVVEHVDPRTVQSGIARALLDFIVEYPCYWRNLHAIQQEWLAQYWFSALGRGTVLLKTTFPGNLSGSSSRASDAADRRALEYAVRNVERSLVRAPSPQEWLDSVFSMANAVGFQRVRLFVDDLRRPPTAREAEQLAKLSQARVDVFVLTEETEVATVLDRHGFRATRLEWTPNQLWQMAFYRLNALSLQAEQSDPTTTGAIGTIANAARRLHEWIDEIPVQVAFTPEGWAAALAIPDLRTPRAMFRFWHALLLLPPTADQSEKFGAASVQSAGEMVRSHAS